MRCKQARHLMAARLDGQLTGAEIAELEDHLTTCGTCQTEWQGMVALDQLFMSASMQSAPADLQRRVMVRIERREQARRAIAGGLALALGTTTVALLTLFPFALQLLQQVGIVPALLVGGVDTATQLLSLVDAATRMLFILLDQLAGPLVVLGSGSLLLALALNGLWIATVRRLRVAQG